MFFQTESEGKFHLLQITARTVQLVRSDSVTLAQ